MNKLMSRTALISALMASVSSVAFAQSVPNVIVGVSGRAPSIASTGDTNDLSITIGSGVKSNSNNSDVTGGSIEGTQGSGAIAIGSVSTAAKTGGIALGFGATSSEIFAMALGNNSSASGINSIALGGNSNAAYYHSVAIGFRSQALANNSVAIGDGSVADSAYQVSFGNSSNLRRISYIANGMNDTDAVTVAQLRAATAASNLLVAGSFGGLPSVTGDQAIHSIALGGGAKIVADSSSGQGNWGAIAIGNKSSVTADSSIALGGNASVTAGSGVAVGMGANVTGVSSIALGKLTNASGQFAVAIGYGSVADQDYTVSFGNTSTKRRLVNLADGVGINDAATYGQLQSTNQQTLNAVNALQSSLTQSTTDMRSYVDATVAKATAGVIGKAYADQVAQAAVSNSNSYTDQKSDQAVSTSKAYTDQSAQATLKSANAYTDQSAQATLKSANTYTDTQVKTAVTTANVYADQVGARAVASANGYTDVQVKASEQRAISAANAYTDKRVDALTGQFDSRINQVSSDLMREINRTGALSMAAAAVAQNQAGKPGDKNRVMVGFGTSGNYTAVSVGYNRVTSANTAVSLNVSAIDGKAMAGGSVGFSW